jgi:L-threonylcarbamoyladenylate synthase
VTSVVPASPEAICEAAGILRRGGLVAFPTETVYGLGADAGNPAAVRAMFAAKGRPPDHPVIVHLAAAAQLAQYVIEVPDVASRLAVAFWPGPLTLVLRRGPRISHLVTGGLETVGIRVPSHPVAQELLRAFGGPLAAPSANRFGRVSATRATHVLDELSGRVDWILDGGECAVGLESTIVDLSGQRPAILRPGAVSKEQIEAVLQSPLSSPTHTPRVSGSLPSHYAPRATVEVGSPQRLWARAQELAAAETHFAWLGPSPPPHTLSRMVFVAVPERAEDYAHALYELLREVDRLGCDVALVVLPPEQGLGVAIADRLCRAAGPR